MDLDFSVLEDLARRTEPEDSQDNQSREPMEAGAAAILQRIADSNLSDKERALQVYKKYQQNMIAVSQMQAELIRRTERGEDIKQLYLKAVYVIALLTNDNVFYDTILRAMRIAEIRENSDT